MKQTRHRLARRRRGAAVVELALAISLLLLIVLGAVDLGRFAYYYIAVTNTARAGAAHGIMNNHTSSTLTTWRANITTTANRETQDSAGTQTIPGMTIDNPTSWAELNGLRRVRIVARYDFNTIVPWPGIPRPLRMARAVEMRMIR